MIKLWNLLLWAEESNTKNIELLEISIKSVTATGWFESKIVKILSGCVILYWDLLHDCSDCICASVVVITGIVVDAVVCIVVVVDEGTDDVANELLLVVNVDWVVVTTVVVARLTAFVGNLIVNKS